MTAPDLITDEVRVVKANLLRCLSDLLDPLLLDARSSRLTARESERRTWQLVVALGAAILTVVWSCLCRRATEQAVTAAGLSMSEIRPRTDKDYIGKVNTTFGRIRFPWSAFRDPTGRTRNPARKLFPHHPKIRSSELLLEWECALAADHPFRKAADALLFFSHGAASPSSLISPHSDKQRDAPQTGAQITPARTGQSRTSRCGGPRFFDPAGTTMIRPFTRGRSHFGAPASVDLG